MKRRTCLKTLLAGVACGLPVRPAGKPAGAFALCGDESHNSDYIRSALTATLVEGAGLPIDFTDQEKLLTYDNLQNYRILIMFRDGLRFPMVTTIRYTSRAERRISSAFRHCSARSAGVASRG